MDSTLLEILDEWEEGMFPFPELLSEAYNTFLGQLVGSSAAERRDPRVIPFLLAGFTSYMEEQKGEDPHAVLTYRMALAMVGRGSNTAPVRPATPPARPAPSPQPGLSMARSPSPQPGPSKPRSPQPGPSKRPREEEDEEEGPTLEVLQTRERVIKRFKTKFREEVIQIKGMTGALPSEQLMADMFDTILRRQRVATQAKDDDRVILEIQSSEDTQNPLWFSMRRTDQMTGQVVIDKLARVLNSNQNFISSEGTMTVSYIHIPTPEAGGRRTAVVPNESIDAWLQRFIATKTIWSPENADNMCLTRRVAMAIARGRMSRQAFYKMKQPTSKLQKEKAETLCRVANIDPTKECGLDELRQLQDALTDFRLCVYTDKRGKECVFRGEYVAGRTNIHLLLHNNHFYAIFYPCQAFESKQECIPCAVFYNHAGEHVCEGVCWRCFSHNDHSSLALVLRRCPDCGHQFAGDECFDMHKTIKLVNSDLTKCNAFKFCQQCKRSYSLRRGVAHVCNTVYCTYCKHNVRENHLCFMQKWKEEELKKGWKRVSVYYDFECTQCDALDDRAEIFEHKPNLLVCHTVCEACSYITQNDHFCNICQTRQHIFHNLDDKNINVVGQFLDYLQSFPAKVELLITAHNAKAYDSVFILQEMIKRHLKPDLVLQGAKIICMKLGNWKFVDSLSFLPMPLSAMPKSFDFQELKKGYWPFLACKPEYYDYEGPLLDRELYCVSGMKSKAAEEFNHWYDEQVAKNYLFNFRRDLIEYCISDVTILRRACQSFRQLFKQHAGFDPMVHCITLSSACMNAFRRNFLKKDTIGIVPPGGYHGMGRQSEIALKWLDYESHKIKKAIQTIYTDREVSVMGRRVDGYVELTKGDGTIEKRIYQFHGDYWHQCPIHFPPSNECGENRLEQTRRLTEMFREAGYKVIEKWECQFKADLNNDPATQAYFNAHPTKRVPPLNIRDTLAGGRTSALRWYHKADVENGEKIKMVDVVSEYPGCNLRGKYPILHPRIFREGDPDMPTVDEWNGLVKCTVLPPRDLFLPVLWVKAHGKLLFPLCHTCVETENTDICRHDDPNMRQLTGSWCSPELQLAIQEKGYELLAVHEVLQYPDTMEFDPETGRDGLLSAYVRCFMALKIESSGWPPHCETNEQKKEFVTDVLKNDGIVINPENMLRRPALRVLSKLILNSFGGKFGERPLRPKTELIYEYTDLLKLATDHNKKVKALIPLGDDCLQVNWMPVEDSEVSLPTSSIVHASFTTCFGRMQLYRYLDVVGKRALYHDTDSCAYISRPDEPDLPLGSHLGELTDQIQEDYGPGSFITEMVCGGPKNYAFKVAKGGDLNNIHVCIKVRGITINKSCDDLVTFDNLKSMVIGEKQNVLVPIPMQIARLPSWKIVTRRTSKNWRAQNNKRRRVGVELTVPIGYNAWGEDEDEETMERMDGLFNP
ncbi:putative DNA polymerase [Frankliniella fusca]|uniref:DNA-directed DNA polymerase n=1 Tax=Frankliniella fusca TaxID=407009 RepID=A0AAE1HSB3_9NEOP|nr:putative DNA polymerase [Frankliniella fusca]